MFHVATMMGPESARPEHGAKAISMGKKRHIGNDFVHVVYKVRLLRNDPMLACHQCR